MTPGGQLQLYVVALNAYALLLIFARSWIYRVPVYRPMVKNFWLSILPLVLLAALVVVVGVTTDVSHGLGVAVAIVGGLIWLLALPNSSYLITELNLNHRREGEPVPLWYDIIAVLTFAMSGVVNMAVSVLLVQIGFVAVFLDDSDAAVRSGPARLAALITILLVSVGIYLGRYLRLNSWDVKSPRRMWRKVADHFDSRAAIGGFVLFCATHTAFLWLMYGLLVGPLLTAVTNQ